MSDESSNFIRARIDADRAAGRWGSRVHTRFPPEPNGYLHIGHVKSIALNFGLARDYDGQCNLRFDDTNPTTEDPEFVEGILNDVRWLGFEPANVFYASDYFDQLYAWAEQLVEKGLAYVDEQSLEEMRAHRGTVTEPGTPSPGRGRSPAENLDLLRRMKAGEFEDGSMVLRAKIDLAHPNMKMRDPLMYRIRHAHHYRTGDAWCIYPMYDWAHGQSDALEGITHSICTLEFENNRELYDWFTAALELEEPPKQIEFARLNLNWTVMSKRFSKRLVADGRVDGWDDPRMPTIAGMRRRGFTPEALRAFAERVGVAKANSVVDVGLLEHAIREDLDRRAARRLAVLDPLEVVLTNWDHARVEELPAADFPDDVKRKGPAPAGVDHDATRTLPLTRTIVIERSDFAEDPPEGFRRLVPGGEVRLMHGYVIRCDEVVKDADGELVQLRCSVDLDTLGRKPEGRKVKGVVHWVSVPRGVSAEVRLYDRLFTVPDPGARTGDYLDDLNEDSLVVKQAVFEPAIQADDVGARYQIVRHGYVYRAPEDADAGLVFNLTVPLKDRWAETDAPVVAKKEAVVDPTANAADQARIKAEQRAAFFAEHADAKAAFADLTDAGVGEEDAWAVVSSAPLRALLDDAVAHAAPGAVAKFLANVLVAEADDVGALPFGGATVGKLVKLLEDGTLNARLGKKVLAELLAGAGDDPRAVAEAKGWVQVSDTDALGTAVDAVLAAHPDEVARYRAGEKKLTGFFMGQVMKATRGKANPGLVQKLLQEKLS